jgi:hypothetical protein
MKELTAFWIVLKHPSAFISHPAGEIRGLF